VIDTSTSTPTLLTVAQLERMIPGRNGRKGLNPSAVTRWITSGCRARNGERIHLAAIRIGGRWMIRPADLDAFFVALAATDPPSTTTPRRRRTPEQRRRASEAAARSLIARGA
jgi:hypothetical protein